MDKIGGTMERYYFILDSNVVIHIFEVGINFNELFKTVIEAFQNQGINAEFLWGDFIIRDIPGRFHDIKNQIKKLIKAKIVKTIDVDRTSDSWKLIADQAHKGNGFKPFINAIKDPYDVDCLFLQNNLESKGKPIILTTDSGIEEYTRKYKKQSLDLVGLSCATKVLLGNDHKMSGLLDKLEKTSHLKQEGYVKTQQRMQVLVNRRQEALVFVTNLVSRLRLKPRIRKTKKRAMFSRRAPSFKKNVEAISCTHYDPIVASNEADCFLCFNQRLSYICPNLEEFPSLAKGKVSLS